MRKINFKNRKFAITLLSVLFVLCVTVGSTFAALGGTTGELQNVFTPAKNIRAALTEPNWNAAEGLKLVPGKTVRKDPMITNTGRIDEYAAIRLTFLDGNDDPISGTDMVRLLNLLEITWSSKWILCGGTLTSVSGEITAVTQPLVFYYQETLTPAQVSDPIFSSIRVKDKITDAGGNPPAETDLRWLQGITVNAAGNIVPDPDGIGSFRIKVEGAAVQTVGFIDVADAAGTLKSMFP